MIRILNSEPQDYAPAAREVLQGVGAYDEKQVTRSELIACLAAYDVLITRLGFQVDRAVIDAGSRLKAIVSATTGLDHIDLDYANQKGITVLSLRGETAFLRTVSATAEHTWGLLLALLRRIPQAFASVQAGGWQRDDFRGHDLDGKCLGILGYGRIGQKVARYGLAFGMRVYAYDPFVNELEPDIHRQTSLAGLLTHSDVLTVHIPHNPSTVGMLGAQELACLPPSAVLVNTSRGEIIDEPALATALQSGQLAGAALDVLCHEREQHLRQQSPLIHYACNHDNLLITPHTGGATYESMAKTEIFMANKLAAFFDIV